MNALAFDPWAALKRKIHPSLPSNPSNSSNPTGDEHERLAGLAGLAADGVENPHQASAPDPAIVLGEDGADPHPPGARLLLMLWARGATVGPGPDGALTITPHPSGTRIPPVLLAAARRHHASLAAWVGA